MGAGTPLARPGPRAAAGGGGCPPPWVGRLASGGDGRGAGGGAAGGGAGGAGGAAGKPTRRNRKKHRCKRLVRLKGGFTLTGKAGTNSFHFTGRLRGHKLKPGRYRLVATPVVNGVKGKPASVRFRIVR